MTVAELIAQLAEASPTATVLLDGDEFYDEYDLVWVEFAGTVVRLHGS
jgi:hypothetical protein